MFFITLCLYQNYLSPASIIGIMVFAIGFTTWILFDNFIDKLETEEYMVRSGLMVLTAMVLFVVSLLRRQAPVKLKYR